MRLFSQDPDGPGNQFSVVARLKSFAKSNGAYRGEICKAQSSEFGPWEVSEGICERLNFDRFIYWVEVVVSRKSPSRQTVEFNAVSLETAIF